VDAPTETIERRSGRGTIYSAKTEYACVALLELASNHDNPSPQRLKSIAEKHGISHRFLVQILLQLKAAGLVMSTRGASGGYLLSRPPAEIRVADIVNAIDPPAPPPDEPRDRCTSMTLAVQSVWAQVLEAQQQILEATTLDDLVRRAQKDYDIVYQI
jgi:Rrf2 family protein